MHKTLWAVAVMAALSGCSSNEVIRGPLDITLGQQLIDLKEAHNKGALSTTEYDDQRRRLIDNAK